MLAILPNKRIRLPTFHLPLIKHGFAEQYLDYQLIKMLNAYGSMTFTLNAQSCLLLWLQNLCEISVH